MASGILGIGTSALNAAQAGILVTGHNIANANTQGYSRQQTVQATNLALGTGSGFFGQGVQVATVQRLYSDFLTTQVNQAQTQSSQLSTYSSQVNQVDNLLGDPALGLSTALQSFFSSVQDVSNNPSSVPSRQSMLSASQSLVSSFQTLGQQLSSIGSSINSQITGSVTLINSYAKQIAQLNQNIVDAQNSSGGQPPNDLMDQRDQLVAQMSKEIQTTVVKQADGSYSVLMGNGQGLVVGNQALTLTAAPSPTDQARTVVGYSSNGVTSILPDSSIVGGNLGGLYAFRTQSLDAAQNALGRIAIGLAQTFNQQNQLGQDLNGNPGAAYFNIGSPSVAPNPNNGAGSAASVALTGSTPTSTLAMAANLSSVSIVPAVTPFDPVNPASFSFSNSSTIYDSLGQSHNASLYYVKTATPNQWLAYSYVDGASADAPQTASSLVSSVISAAASSMGGISAADTSAIQNAASTAAAVPGATAASISTAINAMTSPPLAAATVAQLSSLAAIASQSFTAASVSGATAASIATAISGATGTGLTVAQLGNIATLAASSGVSPIGSPNPSVLQFTAAGAYSSSANLAKSVTLSNGAAPLSFSMDFSQMTQTAAASAVVSVVQNGTTTAAQLTGNDYLLNYNGSATPAWTLTNTTTNQSVAMTGAGTAASPFIADGMSLVVTPPTTTSQSASFVIRPTINGAQGMGLNITDTSQIAAASQIRTASGSLNTGTASISSGAANWPVNANLRDNVTITFNAPASTFNVSDVTTGATLATNVAYTSGNPVSYNGWTVSISGSPAAGDSFSVGPNNGAVTDNSNALLLAGLQTKNTMVGNTASFEGAYSQLISQIGNTARQMQVTSTAQTSLVNQLTQSQQSVSGVNLDEEAANLMRYQQAYQAAGKMMQVANSLFNSILQI